MKKIISIFLAVLTAVSLSASALAACEEDESANMIENRIEAAEQMQQRLQERKERTEARYAVWQCLMENSELRYRNSTAGLNAASETLRLRLDLLNILDSMKNSGVQPSEEIKAKLREYNEQMREIKDTLRQSRNQMKGIRAELRKTVKSNDLAALETVLEQIASLQEQRIELVTNINAILQNMIELVDQN